MTTTRLKRIERRRKLVTGAALIISVIILFLIGSLVSRLFGFYNKIHTGVKNIKSEIKKEQTEYNFLLLGYGGGTHEGTYLTDTIMVAHINLKTKKILLVSIPRDIWVKVPTKKNPFHTKINAVYQMGLFPKNYPDVDTRYLTKDNPSGLVKKVAENITGLHIDGFMAVDFTGFVKTIDTLGGIDVKIDNSFTDYEYPIEGKEADTCDKKDEELDKALKEATESPVLAFPCRYETLKFTAGETHMDGETALKYARSRHSLDDGGDFNRAKRQQKVIEATKEKMLTLNFIPKILPLLDDLEEHIITDIQLSETNSLLLEAPQANKYKITTFVLSDDYLSSDMSDDGQYIIIPTPGLDNWTAVKRKINEIKLGITPTPIPVKVSVTPKSSTKL